MIRQFKNITLRIIGGANIATVIIMLLVGYADRINPQDHEMLANMGLAFPAFLIFNFGFLVFWLIFKKKGALIPIFGYIACYMPLRTYMPMNINKEIPQGAIKVLSYNVFLFAPWDVPDGEPNPIIAYLKDSKADIICLQESSTDELGGPEKLYPAMDKIYQFRDTAMCSTGSDYITIFSKFPIMHKEHIKYTSRGNLSVAYKLKINGDTVILINNHLETNGLSEEDRSGFKNIIKGKLDTEDAHSESKTLLYKLGKAAKKRAEEANAVAEYIAANKGKSIIVCGDFNDNPISYSRRTVSKGLTDCFIETGNGPGISYHKGGMYVRIDNILCSKDWEPYGCKVDSRIKTSDHYPIYCWLKKRHNP